MSFVYYEGAFLPEAEARVPVTDRGLLFGDGAYATIQVREGIPLFLETHLERLAEQCRSFNLAMPPLKKRVINEIIRLNRAEERIWRMKIIVTGGDDPALHLPERRGRLLITLKPSETPSDKPLEIGIFPHPFHICHASYKSLAHLNRLYIMEEARRQGVDDCLTLTEGGIVLEAAFGNLCWVIGKRLYTPSRTLPLYFGVTLSKLIEGAKCQGYRVEEVEAKLDELPDEGAYFRTNTMGGVRPICSIGGYKKGRSDERPLLSECLSAIG
ncbi:MAG: aminotransferase class IV [Chlamydiales bacterium]|nr:aminotransferase class IV [Chlamydiales bacterium]